MSALVVEAGVDELANDERFLVWLREHDIEPSETFKVEIDDSTMTVHQYALNAAGRKYVDQATGQVAYREPFTVERKSDPPLEVQQA